MTRKDFIITLNNRLKPILYLLILIYAVYFFTQVISYSNSNERQLFLILAWFFGIILFLGTIRFILDIIYTKLSDTNKNIINIISKTIEFGSFIALICMAIYTLHNILN